MNSAIQFLKMGQIAELNLHLQSLKSEEEKVRVFIDFLLFNEAPRFDILSQLKLNPCTFKECIELFEAVLPKISPEFKPNFIQYFLECSIKAHQSNNKNNLLLHLVTKKIVKIEELLDKVNPNLTDKRGLSLLMYSISYQPEAVLGLIKIGADINHKNNDGTSVLMHAVSNNLVSAKQLIDAGADIKGQHGYDLYLYAIRYNLDLLEILNSWGVNVDSTNHDGGTPLMYATSYNASAAKKILELGANINHKDQHGIFPLIKLIRHSTVEELENFIMLGADIGVLDGEKNNLIMHACHGSKDGVVERLLQFNFDINFVNKQFKNCLMIAAEHHPSVVPILLEQKPELNQQDKEGNTALMIAYQHEKPIKPFLEAGCDINKTDKQGNTVLMMAIKKKDLETTKTLVKARANFELSNNRGKTPLMYAAQYCEPILRGLLRMKADVNKVDKQGNTALMIASQYKQVNVKDLLAFGASINVINKAGLSASDIFQKNYKEPTRRKPKIGPEILEIFNIKPSSVAQHGVEENKVHIMETKVE